MHRGNARPSNPDRKKRKVRRKNYFQLSLHSLRRYQISMRYREPQTIYFHGIPGGCAELKMFGRDIASQGSNFVVANRNLASSRIDSERVSQIAESLREQFPGRPLRFVGFSLGAAAALRVAECLGEQVEKLDLVSPAAPLELGDYPSSMAGAAVFRSARDRPRAFALMSKGQSWLARVSPQTLFAALFYNANGADRDLRTDPEFRAAMLEVLRESLVENLDTYRDEIRSYVSGWSHVFPSVTQRVAIFHGVRDNWSPPAMAEDLASALPNCDELNLIDDCSHYTALRHYFYNYERMGSARQ